MDFIEPHLYYFDDDGLIPNSPLPLILYPNIVAETETDFAGYLEKLFQRNNWTNNWRDIVLSKNHYHSTTHEVLGISKGSVKLKIGGQKGEEILASKGDILIIPAGVGHFSLGSDTNYEVVGGYPEGRDWNMIYDEPEKREAAKREIEQLPIPGSDPVYGAEGYLLKLWK